MLYADDAGVVSQSPEPLRKMMGVIVFVCAVFGFTVSETKTEIMCLHAKGMPESTTTFAMCSVLSVLCLDCLIMPGTKGENNFPSKMRVTGMRELDG